ncbi:hypothetical protein IFM89_021737 [Coptis chinensis]|uniref:Exocyst complex subunit Exo70 C-terminal domain-containing protein n=1 Tax=Coptis chinensis TaxID=261450 RepID=A0A835IXR9_9MAGN|nr:hypothetical protein IFM89_021737 [Coptis chinensis]
MDGLLCKDCCVGRLDFNRVFGGRVRSEIQNLTRDLIKRVIDGACEIFWEHLVQLELQRQTPPPDGVPRLLSFVTDYCNRLLGSLSASPYSGPCHSPELEDNFLQRSFGLVSLWSCGRATSTTD